MKRLFILVFAVCLCVAGGCSTLPGWPWWPAEPPEPVEWVVHINPESTASPVDSKWKVYGQEPPTHQGRYSSIRWSSAFYENNGCTSGNTRCIVKGADNRLITEYTFYAVDTDNGAHRLSYVQSNVWTKDMPVIVWALLYKDDKLIGAVKVDNPSVDRWFQLSESTEVRKDWLGL